MTPALAQADASVAPTGGEGYIAATQPEPQADLVSIAGPTIQQITPEPEILIANPGTPTTARDPVNITGIGQMVVDAGGGSVGLCTGTLINPRTVLFAAHCVNTRAATAYGANSGGTAIGFGFETNTRANAAGQTDELVRWLLGGAGGAGRYQTNTAQAFYNSNWLNYNPLSLEPASRGFLYGDVAIAALDTPAANIPTWALLFSPLTNTGTIGASGTGYDVGIVGYGQNGTGQTGAAGSDFRRRSAENILGALTDLQTFEGFLFGGVPNGLTQNLYFLDFDDPRRGMTGASPFDFNAFRDNARTNPNGASLEGITSQGDSGGGADSAERVCAPSRYRCPVGRLHPLLWAAAAREQLWHRVLLPAALPLLGLDRGEQSLSLCVGQGGQRVVDRSYPLGIDDRSVVHDRIGRPTGQRHSNADR